ncbi:MAG: hypothetical protein KME17_15445 [Cyanosarcina radialis HA8281-LM2]|jgi:hypothetical protein|nr:hypothetical protein [Cyanosarcina radialis HA8281-LM2]
MLKHFLFTATFLSIAACSFPAEAEAFPYGDIFEFPEAQKSEIPGSGYFLKEVENRCNAGRGSFCNRIENLSEQQKQYIRQQEDITNIPFTNANFDETYRHDFSPDRSNSYRNN